MTSTAGRYRWKLGDLPDLLEAWSDEGQASDLETATRELLGTEHDALLAWMDDDPTRWSTFLSSITWTFDALSLEDSRLELEDLLRQQTSLQAPPTILLERLIVELLTVSTHDDAEQRQLRRQDLLRLLESTEITAWADSALGRSTRELFEELPASKGSSNPVA